MAAGVAIVAVLLDHRRAHAQQRIQLLLTMEDRFVSDYMIRVRGQAAKALAGAVPIEDVEELLDFFESLGLYTAEGALDLTMVHGFFFYWLRRYMSLCAPHMAQRRYYWANAVDLYEKCRKIEKKTYDFSDNDLELSDEERSKFIREEQRLTQ